MSTKTKISLGLELYAVMHVNATFVVILLFALATVKFNVSLGKYHIPVNIFLEESSTDMTRRIVHKAVERYQFDDQKDTLSVNAVQLSFRLVKYNRTVTSILTFNIDHFCSLSTSSCSAIFVEISSHEMFMSSLMRRSNIITVGMFQTSGGIPWTQESPVDFTRIAAPSMKHYACAVRDVVKKMGWRTISLVLSADYESKVFEEEMIKYSREEKWDILHTVWILKSPENRTELKDMIKQMITGNFDAVVVHVRDSYYNDDMFQLVKSEGVNHFKGAWLLTDITTSQVSNISYLPDGFAKISPRTDLGLGVTEHALCDAFHLIELSATRAIKMSRDNEKSPYPASGDNKDLHGLIERRMKNTFFQGKTAIFENPSLAKGPFSTMNIASSHQNVDGHKHWASIGLRTYSGIALEPLKSPNGTILSPHLVPPRPTVRVPVSLYPPWIEAEKPQDTYDLKMTCLKRGYFCYNKTETRINKLCCFGFSIDLLKILERELGFDPEIYIVADGQYGNYDEKTGEWNGIVHELVSGEGDLALDLSLSERRAKYIDFSFPYLPLALNVLVEKKGSDKNGIQWYSWLKPFDILLWLTILGTCNVILLVIWWLDRRSPTGYYHILKETDEDGFTMLDAMSFVWGVAFSKDIGAEKAPRSISARCVCAVYAFMALIIVNTYCANLMAFLVQDDYVLPINGITDPKLKDPSFFSPNGFQLGLLHGTFMEMYFKNHINSDLRQLYDTNLKLNLINNFTTGIKALEKGKIQGLIGDYLSLQQVANKIPGCRFCLAGRNFYSHGVGFAVPKGSPWLDDITQVVLEMISNDSISMLEKVYFDKKTCRPSTAKDLNIMNFSGLFVTVAATVVFCFLALLAEVVAIFALVRFSEHLGGIGKFAIRLLFDAKKGEEHLITLKYSYTINKKRRCISKMDLITIQNSPPDVAALTPIKMQQNSTNTQVNLEELEQKKGCQQNADLGDSILSKSLDLYSNSSDGRSTNGSFQCESISSEVTFF